MVNKNTSYFLLIKIIFRWISINFILPEINLSDKFIFSDESGAHFIRR